MLKKFMLAGILLLVGVVSQGRCDIVAAWTFETSQPTTSGPLAPEVGTGTAVSTTGGTFTSPAGFGSARSWSSTAWDVNDYFQFSTSTVGFTGIDLSWAQTGSNTGPANFNLQYSTDGTAFTTFSSYTVTNDAWNAVITPAASVKAFNLASLTILDNAPQVFFRLTQSTTVSINAGIVASTGTGRVDSFTINGVSAVPEPSAIALVGIVGTAGLVVRYRRKNASPSVAV